jgi:hypothetical protein
MATTRFNSNILAAARRLKDERSSASPTDDTGHVFSSALLSEYENRSVRDVLKKVYDDLGEKAFGNVFPEYMLTSGALNLSAGALVKPADCWHVVDLVKSDLSVKFHKLKSSEIEDVRAAQNGVIVPSATRPVFWEEAASIYTLGLVNATVIARYIKTHPDLVVSTDAVGNGKIHTTAADLDWHASTKVLEVAGTTTFVIDADVGKMIIFRTAAVVYVGRIASVSAPTTATEITVSGDALPAGNIHPSDIIEVLVSDLWPDGTDLLLNPNWYGAIIDSMVAFGLEDLKAHSTT